MKKITLFIASLLMMFILISCKDIKITIMFNTNGGTTIETMSVSQLKPVEVKETTKEGYTFVNWFKDEAFELPITNEFEKGFSRNMVLYAKWEINTYTLTFKANNNSEDTIITNEYNTIFTINDPIKEGSNFIGWYQDAEFTKSFDSNRIPAKNLTIYAKWESLKFEVSFFVEDKLLTKREVLYGEDLLSIPNVPNKEGYLGSWDVNDFSNVTESFKVNAIYVLKEYTVTFKDNDGIVYDEITINHGNKIDGLIDTPEKYGYTFSGYSENLDTFVVTNDTLIIVNFVPVMHSVTFNYRTLVGDGYTSHTVLVQLGKEAKAPNLDIIPGYEFINWDKDFLVISSDLTVNAIYKANSYALSLDANGGLFENGTDELVSYFDFESKIVSGLETPVKLGYRFNGWLDSLGSDFNYSNESTMPIGGISLTAKWVITNYTITYNNLEGSTNSNPSQFTILSNTIILKNPSNREHYNFIGWFSEDTYLNEVTSIENGTNENVVLYAKWEYKTYTISFVIDGVSVDKVFTYNDQVTLEDIPLIPTKIHYDQVEATWNIAPLDHLVEKDFVFTAIYTPNIYTISFDSNGGSSVNNVTGNYDTNIPNIIIPTKEGYTFSGWYIDNETFIEAYELTKFREVITLYAKWTEYPVISFNTNGGSDVTPISNNSGSTITAPNNPTKEHFSFVGWYLDNETFINGYEFTVMPESDLVLYAKWENVKYTVNFNIDGQIESKEFDSLYTLTINDIPSIPTKTHYDQVDASWNINPIDYVLVGNKTFNVLYTANEYVISFNTNDGEEIESITITYNEEFILPNAIKLGYTFENWYLDEDLSEQYYDYTQITSDITLFATYMINRYEVNILHRFEIESLVDSEIISEENTINEILTNLIYGDTINLERSFEGYNFNHFEFEGTTYTNINHLLEVVDNMGEIVIYYRKIILNISFNQDPELFDEPELATTNFRLYYNESFDESLIPALKVKAGFTVSWNRNVFNDLKQNVDVYALYYEDNVKSIAFSDQGVIRYLVSQVGDNNVALGIDAAIWVLKRDGYKFLGWYDSNDIPVEPQELLFSNFSGNTVFVSKWIELDPFSKPTNISIQVIDNNGVYSFIISWDLIPALINDLKPQEFIFVINGNVIIVPISAVTLSGDTYTLNLSENDPLYEDFSLLLIVGKHEVTIQAIGDDNNHYDGEESDIYEFSNDSIFDDVPSSSDIYDYFIVEDYGSKLRYVFYNNLSYTFNENYTFEIISGNEFATANNNKLIMNNLTGSFKFRMTNNGVVKIYDALVVADIRGFAIGNNYKTYSNAQGNDTYLGNDDVYYVGNQNNFYLDISIINNQGSRLDLDNTILDYKISVLLNNTYVLIDESEWFEHFNVELLKTKNIFKFNANNVGNSYSVEVTPKYQANEMQVDTLTYLFDVNNGHNAFTNLQLQELFADMNVKVLNIHANIKAQLATHQLNADGSPINYSPYMSQRNGFGGITGSVYSRYNKTNNNDNFKVNGNFMTIDGSALPHNNKSSGSGTVGFAEAFDVINVQTSIFRYEVFNESTTYNNSTFDISNLQIIGNTTVPGMNTGQTAEEILQEEQLMSKNSGGYVGIRVDEGKATYTNLNIGYTVIAITTNSFRYEQDDVEVFSIAEIEYVNLYESWANSIYSNGTGYKLKNSYIGQSGGPALHVIDRNPGSGNSNPQIYIYNSTKIENWVSGQEAWFKAYGMSGAALALKSGIEDGIKPTGRTILKKVINPVTGLESEMLNVVLLTEPSEGSLTYDEYHNQTSGSEIDLYFVDDNEEIEYELKRSWDYLTTSGDPRIGGGQFGFAVGNNSNFANFQAMIGQLMQEGLNQSDATSAAMLASFYNLSSSEVLQVLYVYATLPQDVQTYWNAINMVIPGFDNAPDYMEVLAPIPLFDGPATIILRLY